MYTDESAFQQSIKDQEGMYSNKLIRICSIANSNNKRYWSITRAKKWRIVEKQGNAIAIYFNTQHQI
jgi:hypothetical protein